MPAVSPRYRVGVIGTGRVGAVLAAALQRAGHLVVAASGASPDSRRRLQTLMPQLSPQKPADVAAAVELVLLTVPDDRLQHVVEQLAAGGSLSAGQVVVHTSGRHGSGVLAAAADQGAVTVALHPAMTFTGTDVDLDRLRGCAFGLSAAGEGLAIGARLADDLGGTATVIPEEQRTLYHAALAHGANHLGTLVGQAMDILRLTGAGHPADLLRPLLTAALDNALTHGDVALTGPVVRGDTRTVSDHLAALAAAAREVPGGEELGAAYATMAAVTANRALRSGRLQAADAADIMALTGEVVADDRPTACADHDQSKR